MPRAWKSTPHESPQLRKQARRIRPMQLLWHARALDVVPASGVTSLIVASVPPAAPVAAGVVVVTVGVAAAELGVDVVLTVVAVVHVQGAMRPRRQRRTLFFAAPRAPGHW